MYNELTHYGIIGMKWGVRRYQNADGSLTDAGRKRLEKQDTKWAKKNMDKITNKAKKASQSELNAYSKELLSQEGAINKNGKVSAATINAYNRKMATLMSEKTSDLRSPSGKVVKFVAKRSELGVYMALATENYNIDQLKNGVWTNGRIAYKKTGVDTIKV